MELPMNTFAIKLSLTFCLAAAVTCVVGCSSASSAGEEETPSALTGEQCTQKEFKGGQSEDVVNLVATRVGVHTEDGGFDRLVFEFAGNAIPKYVVSKQDGTKFTGPGEGEGTTIELTGEAGLNVWFPRATGYDLHEGKPTYQGEKRFPLSGGKGLLEVAEVEDFESNLVWGVGVANNACIKVSTLTNPPRVIIDVSRSLGVF
jgi:hypothetical protein